MESNKQITVSVNSDNKEGCAAVASMFAGLAALVHGEPMLGYSEPITSGIMADEAAPPTHAYPLNAAESFAATQPDATTVDTAAAFAGGAPSIPPTPPAASVAPPAPAAAPSAPATVPPAQLNPQALSNVATDKSGLPWDARINTENRAQTQKGIWKRKPGLEDSFYTAVLEELKATMAAPAAQPAAGPVVPTQGVASVAQTTMAPPPPSATPAAQQPSAPPAPTPPAGGTSIPSPPATAAATPAGVAADEPVPTTYPQLLQAVSQRTMTGKITREEVDSVCQLNGIPNVSMLASRPDLIPTIYEGCKAIWATRG